MATYQSKIYRKGHDQPIYLSKNSAQKISELYQNASIASDQPIDIGGKYIFRKGEIKSIEILPDIQVEKFEADRSEFYRQEKASRDAYLKLPVSRRARDLEMFKLMYKASIGDEASPETLEQARVIQERFFTANPTRTLCDPTLLKTIIPIITGKKISPYARGGLGIIERALARDMQLAN